MRIAYVLTAFVTVAAAGCYDPGDLGDTPFKCSATFPDCPDGYTCNLTDQMNLNRCVRTNLPPPPPLAIPKSGVYPNTTTKPANIDDSSCADKSLEPNDTIAQATQGFDNMVPPSSSVICPTGDIDVYKIDTIGQFAKVEVKYQIAQGDLAVGIFDQNGTLLVSDPNFMVNNACVTYSKSSSQPLYAVVLGAKNKNGTTDENNYTITITKSPTVMTCGTQVTPDMTVLDQGN
jgi:hypothetical protein